MNSAELRAVQAPLKALYKDQPEAAQVTSQAVARLDPDNIAVTVDAWHGSVTAGLHQVAGGSGELACSADMLLQALVACAGVTLRAVATAMGVTIRGGSVTAQGVWDARGTLGVDRATPVGLNEITLRFEVDCDADKAKLERIIQTTERYCVILQTLTSPAKITIETA